MADGDFHDVQRHYLAGRRREPRAPEQSGITVAVATCGRPEALARCLAGLARADSAGGRDARRRPGAVARAARAAWRGRPAPATSSRRGSACRRRATWRSRRQRATCSRSPTTTASPDPGGSPGSSARSSRAGAGRRRAGRSCRRSASSRPGPTRSRCGDSEVAGRPRRPRRRRGTRAAARTSPRRSSGCARSAAGTSGSAPARRAGRPRTRTCSTGSARRAAPSATSLRRSCATSGSRARAGSPRAGRTRYGVGAMCGLWLARGERERRAVARRLRAARTSARCCGALRRRDRDGLRLARPRLAGTVPGAALRACAPPPRGAAGRERTAGDRRDVHAQPPGPAARHRPLRARARRRCPRSWSSSTRATSRTPRSRRWGPSTAAGVVHLPSTTRGLSRARNIGLRAAVAPGRGTDGRRHARRGPDGWRRS